MSRIFLLFLTLKINCISLSIQEEIELKDLLPDELENLMDSLTSEEEEKFVNSENVEDPELAVKLMTSYQLINEKTSKLNQPARDFLNDLFNDLYESDDKELKGLSQKYLGRWNLLSESERTGVQVVYPKIFNTLNSKKFKDFAKMK
ncbi:unnamed protein product [Bursaphelenchus xylophilus]|uniref:(pine wood nematode) hypothetical protein n=1 Tax=Bursaphelenchus xylophilus TaxID=6326 RepID=A0A1I7RS02_BURXY|nr:unnamed protein product [Bursaphelenchus xylophilus]CAG9123349.1 unnamed protein product [Bursaphelenchus xylophilus]